MRYYEKIITELGNRPIKASYRVMGKKIGLEKLINVKHI
jgi:hypothetical protein